MTTPEQPDPWKGVHRYSSTAYGLRVDSDGILYRVDQVTNALATERVQHQQEKDALKAELWRVDAMLGNRSAFDGIQDRVEKIRLALQIASEVDPKGQLAALTAERDTLKAELATVWQRQAAELTRLREALRQADDVARVVQANNGWGDKHAAVFAVRVREIVRAALATTTPTT